MIFLIKESKKVEDFYFDIVKKKFSYENIYLYVEKEFYKDSGLNEIYSNLENFYSASFTSVISKFDDYFYDYEEFDEEELPIFGFMGKLKYKKRLHINKIYHSDDIFLQQSKNDQDLYNYKNKFIYFKYKFLDCFEKNNYKTYNKFCALKNKKKNINFFSKHKKFINRYIDECYFCVNLKAKIIFKKIKFSDNFFVDYNYYDHNYNYNQKHKKFSIWGYSWDDFFFRDNHNNINVFLWFGLKTFSYYYFYSNFNHKNILSKKMYNFCFSFTFTELFISMKKKTYILNRLYIKYSTRYLLLLFIHRLFNQKKDVNHFTLPAEFQFIDEIIEIFFRFFDHLYIYEYIKASHHFRNRLIFILKFFFILLFGFVIFKYEIFIFFFNYFFYFFQKIYDFFIKF